MIKAIPSGIHAFDELITKGYFYVDKTMIIKDVLIPKAMQGAVGHKTKALWQVAEHEHS